MNGTEGSAGGSGDALADGTDEELLERISTGEQGALSALYDRYQGIMYGMATRITGDRTLASDVVQEAFLGIWRNAARYQSGRASARTWILSITHHRAVDAVRRRRPSAPLPEIEVAVPAALTLPDIWDAVGERLDADDIRRALDSLPANQREAIELAYFGGLTQQEIATQTATPLGTVKSRVRLGLLQMRRVLDADRSGVSERAAPEGAR
jgi:RNA polymerase sigma-70 factor, ECF subfamily